MGRGQILNSPSTLLMTHQIECVCRHLNVPFRLNRNRWRRKYECATGYALTGTHSNRNNNNNKNKNVNYSIDIRHFEYVVVYYVWIYLDCGSVAVEVVLYFLHCSGVWMYAYSFSEFVTDSIIHASLLTPCAINLLNEVNDANGTQSFLAIVFCRGAHLYWCPFVSDR